MHIFSLNLEVGRARHEHLTVRDLQGLRQASRLTEGLLKAKHLDQPSVLLEERLCLFSCGASDAVKDQDELVANLPSFELSAEAHDDLPNA